MDQEQRITVKIAEKTYELNASSEEKERLIRLAAEDLNAAFGDYSRRFCICQRTEGYTGKARPRVEGLCQDP